MKFDFNADMRHVYARLAQRHAGMAEAAMHRTRNADYPGSNPGASPILEQELSCERDAQAGVAIERDL